MIMIIYRQSFNVSDEKSFIMKKHNTIIILFICLFMMLSGVYSESVTCLQTKAFNDDLITSTLSEYRTPLNPDTMLLDKDIRFRHQNVIRDISEQETQNFRTGARTFLLELILVLLIFALFTKYSYFRYFLEIIPRRRYIIRYIHDQDGLK